MTDNLFESQILAFERAWQRGDVPDVRRFLPQIGTESERLRLLHELVCVDLEFRWRKRTAATGTAATDAAATDAVLLRIEDYLRMFPELGSSAECGQELIAEEYRVRQRWGVAPQHVEYFTRFPNRAAWLQFRLPEIDCELAAEVAGTIERPATKLADAPDVRRQPAQPDPRAPLPYHDYLLQELIGSGGMGKVYRALQRSLQRTVAVKFLRKSFLDDPQAVERFITEARTVARLDHPGIVTVHGLGQTPWGSYFIVLRFLEGRDLARRIQAAPIPVPAAVQWMLEICDAIQHAHGRGVVHCDLKPANILVAGDGRACVTDFGLARSVVDDSYFSREFEGTAPFMAPEQACRSWGEVGPSTDVYGLGAVFYALLTRRPPWSERRVPDILAKVVSASPVAPAIELDPTIPPELNAICARCLAKRPGDRFSSAAELRKKLCDWLASRGPERDWTESEKDL